MLQYSSLIFAMILGVNGQCSLAELPKYDDNCNAEISCYKTTGNIEDILLSWSCRKSGRRSWVNRNYHSYYEYVLDTDYILSLTIIDIDVLEDLSKIIDLSDNVININIEEGDLVSIPIVVGSLLKLSKFSLTYNKVETINLRQISAAYSMKYLNVSHNYISTIEDDLIENSASSSMATIDLSYNQLESLPDNCFARFTQLKYLDLSFNLLAKFDILTFEGITQLEIFKLSNNKVSDIGQTFARFRKLRSLNLEHNNLTLITDFNFRNLISLEKLNLSSNFIKNIEDRSLTTMSDLKQLDLSHNRINVIHKMLFENNLNMYQLSLSYNDIEHIEGGAFSRNNISSLDIQNNFFSGSIEYDTFLGISTENLDLSNGKLTTLGDKAFSCLSSELRYLNISNNLLENITHSAFQSLENLIKLDLSFNNLIDFDFNTSSLKNLTEYYLQNNKIKKITSYMFKNMTSLLKLDLSQNKIVDIELNSFIELINLRELTLNGNNFVNYLTSNAFQGLYMVTSLVLSQTRLKSCFNESFTGMTSLNYINISYSQLEKIEYDTFKATGNIQIMDLSHNILENFHINTLSVSKLSELYLNHNKLYNITSKTFEHLRFLEILSLGFNNIFYIDSSALQTLFHLRYLDFYSNSNLHIKSDLFTNLTLSEISLDSVRKQFDFKNSLNTSITTLILSECDIKDINSVFVHKIKYVYKLDISINKIKILDKGSFVNMTSLTWLDISSNIISTIQPGTFLTNNMINTLNLYDNHLQYLQFGVLDGLRNLRVLNLSNNEIHSFGINLLHASPHLSDLFLENNLLQIINLTELAKTSVLLTIGGNNILCDTLVEWNKLNYTDLNVTTEITDFDSENFRGIPCKTISLQDKNINRNNYANLTSKLTEIKETVGQLSGYLNSMKLNETFSTIIDILGKISKSSNHNVFANLNYSQKIDSDQLRDLLLLNKMILPHLANTSDNVENDIQLMISLLKTNNNLTVLSNSHKELSPSPVSSKTVQIQENLNSTEITRTPYEVRSLEVRLDHSTLADIKVLLYFIAVCLAIIILFYVGILVFKHLYKQSPHRVRISNLYESGETVRNGLEME